MITAKIEAVGLMRLPYAPPHYTNALAPQSFARLLKAIEPDAREVIMNPAPGAAEERHVLNIRGAVAGFVPFNAFYNVSRFSQREELIRLRRSSLRFFMSSCGAGWSFWRSLYGFISNGRLKSRFAGSANLSLPNGGGLRVKA
jgi:hypothetical protein